MELVVGVCLSLNLDLGLDGYGGVEHSSLELAGVVEEGVQVGCPSLDLVVVVEEKVIVGIALEME